ncbi:hypothetical protein D3C78_1559410 [compost metagenome]
MGNLRAQQAAEGGTGQALAPGREQRARVQRCGEQGQVQGVARYVEMMPQVVQAAFGPFPALNQFGVEGTAQMGVIDARQGRILGVGPNTQ